MHFTSSIVLRLGIRPAGATGRWNILSDANEKLSESVSLMWIPPYIKQQKKCVISDASATGKTDELFIESVTKSTQLLLKWKQGRQDTNSCLKLTAELRIIDVMFTVTVLFSKFSGYELDALKDANSHACTKDYSKQVFKQNCVRSLDLLNVTFGHVAV